MAGEVRLSKLLKGMTPRLNEGVYVFSTVKAVNEISRDDTICEFKEAEGTTIVLRKEKASQLYQTIGIR